MQRLTVFAVLATAAVFLSAQTVDRAELESSAGKSITFYNYEGPHDRIDTLEAIRGIGASLGTRADASTARRAGDGKYSVIRIRDTAATGFDADILTLGANAGVDHIRNLRAIVAGYLETSYAFSRKDASLLAEFITVYNAVYRKDMKYFASKYKPLVIAELKPETAGLSTRWDEWAGRSAIVIPLSEGAGKGNVSSVDTTSLTEKPVVDKLKTTEADKGVEPRREMTDLKEKEVAAAKKDIEAKKETITADEKKIADEKARLEADRKKLEDDKKAAAARDAGTIPPETGTADSGTTPETGANPETGASSATIKEREAEIAKREDDLRKKEAETAASTTAVAKKEETVKAKEEEIRSDRAAIASDMKETIKAETGAVPETPKPERPITLLKAEGSDSPLSSLVVMDLVSGKKLRGSVVNSIRGRTLVDSGTVYIAVAGSTGGDRAVKLVQIGKEKLDIVKEGSDELFPETLLFKSGDSLYAVMKDKGGWVLGRFDSGLALKAKTEVGVHPYTAIMMAENGMLVQTGSGFTIVDKDTLKKIQELK